MDNWIEKLIYAAAATSVLLMLGISLKDNTPTVVSANPIKANQAQYDRVHDAVFYAQNSK